MTLPETARCCSALPFARLRGPGTLLLRSQHLSVGSRSCGTSADGGRRRAGGSTTTRSSRTRPRPTSLTPSDSRATGCELVATRCDAGSCSMRTERRSCSSRTERRSSETTRGCGCGWRRRAIGIARARRETVSETWPRVRCSNKLEGLCSFYAHLRVLGALWLAVLGLSHVLEGWFRMESLATFHDFHCARAHQTRPSAPIS